MLTVIFKDKINEPKLSDFKTKLHELKLSKSYSQKQYVILNEPKLLFFFGSDNKVVKVIVPKAVCNFK